MTDTLDDAEAIIAREDCRRGTDMFGDPDNWCDQHMHHMPLRAVVCKGRPEVADVAAQLLAQVRAVTALHHRVAEHIGGYCYSCSTPWPCPTARAMEEAA